MKDFIVAILYYFYITNNQITGANYIIIIGQVWQILPLRVLNTSTRIQAHLI
jgi:hypothetical protein